jgi:RecA-family ATPase
MFYPDTECGREHPDAEEFARKHDVPGQAVYDAVNLFADDATERRAETAAEIERLSFDIDCKDIEEPIETVIAKLEALVYPPSEIRHSGHGVHVDFNLKERLSLAADGAAAKAVRERLSAFLCSDTSINHEAALLRRLGTTNTKDRDNPVVCRTVVATGTSYDLHDLVDLMDEYADQVLLTRKEKKPGTNGGGEDQGRAGNRFRDADGRLNIEEAVASLGADGKDVNDIQPRIIMALLQKAVHPTDIVKWLVEETIRKAKEAGANWDAKQEHEAVMARCRSATNRLNREYDPSTGVIPVWLAAEFHEAWLDGLAAGRRPKLICSYDKWRVRTFEIGKGGAEEEEDDDQETGEARAESAKANGEKSGTTPPPGARQKTLVLQPFVPFDASVLAPRSWLYGKHYQRRTVSLTAGPGGMGKSSLGLVEAVAMVSLRALLGEQPTERLRVWVHNGEDPMEEILRRIAAICQHHGVPMEELQDFLWLTSGNEFPLRVAKGYANLEINAGLVRQISNAISDNEIDVAIFDPLVTLHSVSENDAGKMDAVIRLFASIADENDASVELNQHVRKPPPGSEGEHDLHDIRGAMAITDAVRAARVLNRMSRADAESTGIDDIARLSYFRVDRAKGNFSPAQAAVWRRFESVILPNTDEVGVVEPWDFPGQGRSTPEKAAADQKAERVFLLLLDKYEERGINVSTSIGPNYAPARFAGEREAKAEKVSRAGLKAAMHRLLDDHRISTEATGRTDRGKHRLVRWRESVG